MPDADQDNQEKTHPGDNPGLLQVRKAEFLSPLNPQIEKRLRQRYQPEDIQAGKSRMAPWIERRF